MALTAPAANNVSPLTEVDNTANPAALTRVGPRTAGLPTGSDQIDSLITRAYDLAAYTPFRRRLCFAEAATAKITRQSHNGAVVQLNLVTDLDDNPVTATLVEDYDVVPTPLTSFKSDIILNEYGRVVTTTALARGTTMIPLDPIAAERVGFNMGATFERLAYNTVIAAGGITNAGAAGGVPAVVTGSTPSGVLRAASQSFKTNNVAPYDSGHYKAMMAPSAETALRGEADAAGWRYWQINQNHEGGTGSIAEGYVGTYENFDIYVTSLLTAGAVVFTGKDGLAKASSMAAGFGPMPSVVVSPVVDRLRRFASVGWYWLGGFARFRAEATLTGVIT
jgi:N4-gp56 family major capsid protein